MRNLLFSVPQSGHQKIPFSDVVVTGTRNQFYERKWRKADIQVALWVFSVHLLSIFAPFTFSWDAFWVTFIGYLLTGLVGITLSYHRLLAHHSLKLPKWLEYTCVYFGVLAAQIYIQFLWKKMLVVKWKNHLKIMQKSQSSSIGSTTKFSETALHASISSSVFRLRKRYAFTHQWLGWLFYSEYIFDKHPEWKNVKDLKKQGFYRFIKKTYMLHILGCGVLLYARGGFPYLVWGMGVRTVLVYHLTFLVNFACHIWGHQAWNTGDLSKNNWWVAIFTFGEGWHNNHHAFEFSARHGLEWWQIDISWYIIRFLEALGLAINVKMPTNAHKLNKSFNAYNSMLK